MVKNVAVSVSSCQPRMPVLQGTFLVLRRLQIVVLKATFFFFFSYIPLGSCKDDLIFSCSKCQFYKYNGRRQVSPPVALISTNISTYHLDEEEYVACLSD